METRHNQNKSSSSNSSRSNRRDDAYQDDNRNQKRSNHNDEYESNERRQRKANRDNYYQGSERKQRNNWRDDNYNDDNYRDDARSQRRASQNDDYQEDDRPLRRVSRDAYQDSRGGRKPIYTNSRGERDTDPSINRNQKNLKKYLIFAAIAIGAIAIAATLFGGNKKVQIIAVNPNYITMQVPTRECGKVGTTNYVKNQKNGTEGALIGGATGAVAGGVIGHQVNSGGGTVVGAAVGGVTGALIGRGVERSSQPDYVARHGSTTKCNIVNKSIQKQLGYTVQYLYKDKVASVIMQNAPAVGMQINHSEFEQLVAIQQVSQPVAQSVTPVQ